MDEYLKKDFAKLLKRGLKEARDYMAKTDSDVARIYDRNMERIPVTVDLYGKYALIQDYGESNESEIIDTVSRYAYVPEGNIIFKTRRKTEGREQRGASDESLKVEVKESGLVFECELLKYTDTGLFLDQAGTRDMVGKISNGMRVLNLFSYTGSFSVYAASGGADRVVSVDLSNVYTAVNRRNFSNNGFLDESRYVIVCSDALAFLRDSIEKGEKYDLVIFDPPSFSNSHKAADFDLKKDCMYYLSLISGVMGYGSTLIFSENLSGFELPVKALKPYWKITELTEDLRAVGFSSRRSSLRVWGMAKCRDMDQCKKAVKMDDERLEIRKGKEAKKKTETEKKRSYGGTKYSDKVKYREETPRYNDRPKYQDRGYRDERSGYDRPRYSERPKYSDKVKYREETPRYNDRPKYPDRGYRDERSGYDRPRYSEKPKYSDKVKYREETPRYNDRPKYPDRGYRDERSGYDRPSYSERPKYSNSARYREGERPEKREAYRQRSDFPGRSHGDNDTGRMYREDFGKRKREAPKPYGYDNFKETKRKDSSGKATTKKEED